MKVKDAAAWKKPTKNGGTYLSVKITFEDGTSSWVNLFDNRFKQTEKQPDMKTIVVKVDPDTQFNEPPFPLPNPDDEGIPF